MDFELSDEQAMLRDMLRRFVAERYGAEQRRAWRAEAGGWSRANLAMLGDMGVLGVALPEAAGGFGGRLDDVLVVMEALGAGLVVEPVLGSAMIAAPLVADLGGERWLADAVAGRATLALAYRDETGQAAHIDRAGRLDAVKPFVPDAGDADVLVACVGPSGPELCRIPGDAPGLSRQPMRLVDGSTAAAVRCVGVAIAPGDRLPCPPEVLAQALRRGAVAAAAEMLGILDRLLQTTLAFVRTRQQFGAAIGSFQAVRHRMARTFVTVEQARSLVLRAALTPPADPDWPRAVQAMQTYLEEAALDVAHACVQMHGGIGITDELDVAQGQKRLLLLRRLFAADGAFPLPSATPLERAA